MDAEVKREVVEKKVYEDDRRRGRYATQGEALGIGIPALASGVTALALMFGRNRCGNAGSGMPENVNIVNGGSAGNGVSSPTAFQAWAKGCDEAIDLTNAIWRQKVNTLEQMYAHRNTDIAEKFGLYKSQVDGDFGLYKSQRDLYDVLNERYAQKFNELDKEVAVLKATRPYQDKLIQCEIDRAYTAAINHTDRRTCRMIEGQVVLPNTPTVTGFGSVGRCTCPAQSGTQAAA